MSSNVAAAVTPQRLLIVSATAPGKGHVGEIILRDVILGYPKASTAVLSTRAPSQPDPLLEGHYQLRVLQRPGADPIRGRVQSGGRVRKLLRNLAEVRATSRLIAEQAAQLAKQLRADKVWLVLNSAEMIAAGPLIAKRLALPLVSLVWDPPGHLLQAPRFDRITRSLVQARFSETLALSKKIAVVSENMATDYARDSGVETVMLRRGVEWIGPSRERQRSSPEGDFVIGFAGALHAQSAWDALIRALDQVHWRVLGRNIRLRMLGSSLKVSSRSAACVEYLGWRDDSEVSQILSSCDATYLPFPFEARLADMARYSFPTKLSSYIALGLPVLAHAHAESSVAHFMRQQPVGVLCSSLDAGEIRQTLESLISAPAGVFESACLQVHQSSFSRRQFMTSFARFIDDVPGTLG